VRRVESLLLNSITLSAPTDVLESRRNLLLQLSSTFLWFPFAKKNKKRLSQKYGGGCKFRRASTHSQLTRARGEVKLFMYRFAYNTPTAWPSIKHVFWRLKQTLKTSFCLTSNEYIMRFCNNDEKKQKIRRVWIYILEDTSNWQLFALKCLPVVDLCHIMFLWRVQWMLRLRLCNVVKFIISHPRGPITSRFRFYSNRGSGRDFDPCFDLLTNRKQARVGCHRAHFGDAGRPVTCCAQGSQQRHPNCLPVCAARFNARKVFPCGVNKPK
jgi:hypothetical protein